MTQRRAFCSSLAVGVLGVSTTQLRAAIPPGVASAPAEISSRYFGMHFHRLVRKPGEPAPTVWPDQVTIGTLRLWDSETRWADVAPYPGRWDFDRMDAYVSRAAAHGASVLYTLGSTPRWASARPDEPGPYGPGCAAEPRRMADWVEYLRQVIGRYRGVVHAYELWNEPNFSDIPRDRGAQAFYTGSVAAMVEMARTARRVIDELDPAARLATPGFVNGPDRLGLFLGAGGANLVDAVAYHFYSNGTARFMEQLGEVREVMQRAGLSDKPLWNTECGVETEGGQEPTTPADMESPAEFGAASLMAQLLLLGAASGIERFDYYAWDNGRTGMIDRQGQARPRQAAYAQVQRWLLGTRVSAVERLPGGVVRIWAQRGAERFVFAWAERDAPLTLSVPQGWRVTTIERLFEAPETIPPRTPRPASPTSIGVAPRPMRLQLVGATAAASP